LRGYYAKIAELDEAQMGSSMDIMDIMKIKKQ
jgi:hypothetical protein